MSHVHTARWQAPACPTCGSAPLLAARSARAKWMCPACCGYFSTDLNPVPRSVVADALPNAGATPRRPSKAQDQRAEVGSPTKPPGTDDVRPQLAEPVQADQLGLFGA